MRFLVLFFLLAACQGPSVSVCPRLVEYPVAFQREAAVALESAHPTLVRLVEDYGRLRAEIRAVCR